MELLKMKWKIDVWDVLIGHLLGFYVAFCAVHVGDEGDIDGIHDVLVHGKASGLVPIVFSVAIYPVFKVLGIKSALLFSRLLVLLVFACFTKFLRGQISKFYGEETGMAFYLITAVQTTVGMNASRLLLDNYSFIIGTLSAALALNQNHLYLLVLYVIWTFWNFSLWFEIDFISSSRVSSGSIWTDLQIITFVFGCLSQKPQIRLIDPKTGKLLIFLPIFIIASALSLSKLTILPLVNIISARGVVMM